MKKFLVQSILIIIVISGALIFANPTGKLSNVNLPFLPQSVKTSNLQINDQQSSSSAVIKVEIADTDEKRRKGLAGRDNLGENEGMLFIFNKTDKYPFWMKGMKFALDFVWIKGEKVVDILQNAPAPQLNQQDPTLPVYSANTVIDKVLELSAGEVQKLNIKVGDTIQLKVQN